MTNKNLNMRLYKNTDIATQFLISAQKYLWALGGESIDLSQAGIKFLKATVTPERLYMYALMQMAEDYSNNINSASLLNPKNLYLNKVFRNIRSLKFKYDKTRKNLDAAIEELKRISNDDVDKERFLVEYNMVKALRDGIYGRI